MHMATRRVGLSLRAGALQTATTAFSMSSHCHRSACSMQSQTAAARAPTRLPVSSQSQPRPRHSLKATAQPLPGWPSACSSSAPTPRRFARHRTAAAAPDTLVAEESSQQPSVDFLGVLNDMQTVKGVLETPADADLVYAVLTDYDSCSRVFRNISGSQTLFTDEGQKQVIQACKWQFLAFKGTFNVHLNVTEAPQERLLVFTLAESSFMRDFEGRWQVEPLPEGGSRIEHVLAVKPLLNIPAAVAPYTSSIFKSQVAALLADLQGELDRQADAAAAAAS